MSFRRTSHGLSNLHLFLGASVVVILEGGESISVEEANSGGFSSASEDIKYWQVLFQHYFPEQDIEYRSVGSKQVVSSIARDIEQGNISKVVAVMDRDFDDLTNNKIESGNVLYTYGYAWENDCCSATTVTESVMVLAGMCPTQKNRINTEALNLFKDFEKAIKQAVKADSLMIQNSQSFFDRDKYARYIEIENNGMPKANIDQLKKSFCDAKNKVERPVYRKAGLAKGTLYDCFGHLLAYYSYRVLCFLLKSNGDLPNIPKFYAFSIIITQFKDAFKSNDFPDLRNYYDSSFGRVVF